MVFPQGVLTGESFSKQETGINQMINYSAEKSAGWFLSKGAAARKITARTKKGKGAQRRAVKRWLLPEQLRIV